MQTEGRFGGTPGHFAVLAAEGFAILRLSCQRTVRRFEIVCPSLGADQIPHPVIELASFLVPSFRELESTWVEIGVHSRAGLVVLMRLFIGMAWL